MPDRGQHPDFFSEGSGALQQHHDCRTRTRLRLQRLHCADLYERKVEPPRCYDFSRLGNAGVPELPGSPAPEVEDEVTARRWPVSSAIVALVSALALRAMASRTRQAGAPRTSDGRVKLDAPTPRTPDGKPDLSGLWQTIRTGHRSGRHRNRCATASVERASSGTSVRGSNGDLPLRPWAFGAAEQAHCRQQQGQSRRPLPADRHHAAPQPSAAQEDHPDAMRSS